jgi:hypothetical protein
VTETIQTGRKKMPAETEHALYPSGHRSGNADYAWEKFDSEAYF